MAFIKPNPLLKEIHGKIGNLYISRAGDELVLKKVPERHPPKPPSPAQEVVRKRLMLASEYWRMVQTQPEEKAVYVTAAKLARRRAIDLAKADYLHAPAITDIDCAAYSGKVGDILWIRAEDDFEVKRVQVRVLRLDGSSIESGDAILDVDRQAWRYTGTVLVEAGVTVTIEAAAFDRPGNRGTKRVDHACGERNMAP